jgi:hypothetical protein
MKNLFSPIFRLIKRQPLRLVPLSVINPSLDANRALPPQRHSASLRQVFKPRDDQQHTNQLSS